MKKIYAVLLTVVLVIGLTVPAFAANSPTADTIKLEKEAPASGVKTPIKDGKISKLPADVKKEVANVTSNPLHLGNLNVSPDARLVSSFRLDYPANKIPSTGIQIPFIIKKAKAGDLVSILHRRSDNLSWEKVGEVVLGSDLTVVGTFNNISTVAIMVLDSSNVVANGVRAPKTGE